MVPPSSWGSLLIGPISIAVYSPNDWLNELIGRISLAADGYIPGVKTDKWATFV